MYTVSESIVKFYLIAGSAQEKSYPTIIETGSMSSTKKSGILVRTV